jgi:hypothetical protein
VPWFKVDDSFHSHPKVLAAGNEATGLYVRCGSYAAEHLTDGFIPEQVANLYGAAHTGSRRDVPARQGETLAETLVRTKLWRRARGGWRMPDYLDYNPSRTTVENDRKLTAERQKRWREAKRRRVTNASGNATVTPAPTRPAPKAAGRGWPPRTRAAANGAAPRRASDRTRAGALAQ